MTENFNTIDCKSPQFKLDEIILDAGVSTFENWLSELNASKDSRSKSSISPPDTFTDNSTSDGSNIPDFWLPAVPFGKAIFAGFITYVDEHGIMYMYDFHKKDVLNVIRNAIDEHCCRLAIGSQEPVKWVQNDACLAKFHLDGQYHRAVVLELPKASEEITVSIYSKWNYRRFIYNLSNSNNLFLDPVRRLWKCGNMSRR